VKERDHLALLPTLHGAVRNGPVGQQTFTILFLALLTVQMIGCGGGNDAQSIQADPNSTQSQTSGGTNTAPITNNNSATLAWDPIVAGGLSGYRVYYGTAPGTYLQPLGQSLPAGNVTTYTVTGLSRGTRYYFAVTAVDAAGNESGFSQEVFKEFL